jgi:hypothetical protein
LPKAIGISDNAIFDLLFDHLKGFWQRDFWQCELYTTLSWDVPSMMQNDYPTKHNYFSIGNIIWKGINNA